MGFLDFLSPKKKPKHELKWALPEARLTAPVEDAEKIVGALKKNKARFVGGGEFSDVIYAKQYAEGIFSYFILRVDKKTQHEKLFADAYMLQEEDRLGVEVTATHYVDEDLEKLGYAKAFARELAEWRFVYGAIRASVFDISNFGAFLEVALPETKLVKVREANEKTAFDLFKKLGFAKEQVIPTDAITLQMVSLQQATQAPQPRQGSGSRFGSSGAGGIGGKSLF